MSGTVMGGTRFVITCSRSDGGDIRFHVPKGQPLGRAVLYFCAVARRRSLSARSRREARQILADMLKVGSTIGTTPEWVDAWALKRAQKVRA